MNLHKVSVENFRAIRSLTQGFEDPFGHIRPVTVLAGPNGCGKTSVLFAIVQCLRGAMGYRTNDVPEPTSMDIHRISSVPGLLRSPVTIRVELDLELSEEEFESIPQVMEDTRDLGAPDPKMLVGLRDRRLRLEWRYPPNRRPDGTLEPYWYVRTDPGAALPWFWGRRFAIRGWLQRRLRDRKLLDSVGGIYLFPQDRNLQSRVVGPGEISGLSNHAEPGDDDYSASPAVARDQQPVASILAYLSSYARGQRESALPDEENWEKRVQDQFKSICGPKEYLGFMYESDDPIGAPYFRDVASVYPLKMAASGEQVIIEYITRLTYPNPLNHSLILIDEPEVHLHPRWIRQLYRALPHIGQDNQYIVTTHSSELRALAAEDNCLCDLGELGG